jgi:hypothetical protein
VSSADPPLDNDDENENANAEYARESSAAEHVRRLARQGTLAKRAATASDSEYVQLFGGGYEIVWPVVFDGLTRRVERGRRHHGCAGGVEHLEPDCLDRYQDDVEVVVDDLLRNAKVPIQNLEGWIRSRLTAVTIDGHRKRRGERGAQQRPRLPKWLATLLAGDPWLTTLAVNVLTWVGIPATAGTGLWPYGTWADRRAAVTGDVAGTEHDVARDVETVLAAMRQNPTWYEKFVEGPLGRKPAPLLLVADTADESVREQYLVMARRHEADDALLAELAGHAIDAMDMRIGRGEDPGHVVVDIITAVFGAGSDAEHMDLPPGAGSAGGPLPALLADPASIERIVRQVLDILETRDA